MLQKLTLRPLEDRLKAVDEAGYNTFLLQNNDVFMGAWVGVRGLHSAGGVQWRGGLQPRPVHGYLGSSASWTRAARQQQHGSSPLSPPSPANALTDGMRPPPPGQMQTC